MIFSVHNCKFGYAAIATSDDYVCGIEIGADITNTAEALEIRFEKTKEYKEWELITSCKGCFYPERHKIVNKVLDNINYNTGNIIQTCLVDGTPFQKSVWNVIKTIPIGSTLSYKEIAEKIDHPNAYRAIGSACNKNPIAILIPCHRVVSSSGKDTGYRWGLDIKKKLLEREKCQHNWVMDGHNVGETICSKCLVKS